MVKRISKFLKKNLSILIASLTLLVLIEIGFLVKLPSSSDSLNESLDDNKLRNYAQQVLDNCSKKTFAPSCYDEQIPALLDSSYNLSLEDAFKVARFVQEKDNRYLYCHVLAHKIAGKETKKDLNNWKEVITRCPYTMCNNGCPHGALMERFKDESLTDEQIEQIKPELPDICEPRNNWHPRNIEISMCYHAMGHLHMYMSNANIQKSLELCQYVGMKKDGRNYVQTCTEGVFMQIFQPLEPEDIALVKNVVPKKDEVDSFCKPYSGEAFDACHRESWAFFRKEIETPQGLTKFCSYTNEYLGQKKCYSALMNIITINFLVQKYDTEGLNNFCTQLPKEWVGNCFSNAARRLMQIDPIFYADKAINVCEIAAQANEQNTCYELLANNSRDSFQPQSKEFMNYCNKLPETWKEKCLTLN